MGVRTGGGGTATIDKPAGARGGGRKLRIEQRDTPNRRAGRGGRRPIAIVAHTTDGGFEAAAQWFADPRSGVSSHYLVGLDGRVASFVAEEDTAHHAGRVREPAVAIELGDDPNLTTIGIEFEDGGDPLGVERGDAQYAAGAALLRAIAERWGIALDREHVIGHRELFRAKDCPGNLDLERLLAEAFRPRPGLVCLLPVRNGARDLPGYLDSVRGFADAVVALDDGSTDETRAILEADPLVAVVLSNPPRETYAGWDDAENRSRLLAAAATLDPEWLLFLDADERIPADDGAALREFLSGDALPGVAYGLRLHRMWGERAEPGFRYVYRLFASVPELEIEGERLHFNPVPESIPRQAWMRTTLRIQHLGAASAERVDARARKYAEADPAGEHPSELDPPPAGELVDWRPRKPGEGVLETEPGNLLVCLLPVRNGARDLPGYLDSVRGFADAVVALDDGSTDETRAILEADPLVAVVLSNPPRETYAGWDDAENRSRLLAAAATLDPEWLLFLDTDERIPADDGAALRRFVAEQAMPGYGYLFRVHRMVDGGYDRDELWVGRLFAYEPGQRLAGGLHLVPLPASIPDERRLRSSFRIQHLGGETEGRRRERHRKYREADPTGDYARLLEGPGEVRPWEPRPVGLPAVLEPGPARRGIEEQLAGELAGPVLSAVVIAHRDAATIADAVASVVGQECPEPFEVIVVTSGGDETAAVVAERFKGVRVVELPGTALPGRARNAGVAVARGDYVSFPGSHVRLRPGSLAARIRAHRRGYPMVTGSLINGTPTRSGWASYFLDHAGALPGRPSAELSGPPAHCSYDREILLRAGGFPEDMRAGEDTVLNNRLHELGYRAYRSQEIELEHRSPCTNPQRLVRHHFARGRGLGRILAAEGAWVGRRIGYVPERVAQTTEKVDAWGGELRATYRRVKPFVALGALAAWLGAVVDPLLRRVR